MELSVNDFYFICYATRLQFNSRSDYVYLGILGLFVISKWVGKVNLKIHLTSFSYFPTYSPSLST